MPLPDQSCGDASATPDKGSRQKAHRQRQKEKRQAVQRQLRDLTERVEQLELEKAELRGALGNTSSVTQRLAQKMAYCLDMMDAAPTSMQRPFQQQLEDLVHELLNVLWCMIEHNMSTLAQLHGTNVVDPSAPLPASRDSRDFPTILARMQLGVNRAKQLLATRRAWLNAMGAITAEPDDNLAYLKDAEEEQYVASMAGLVECGHVRDALSTTVNAMGVCRTFYLSYIHTYLLTPLQTAHYVVGCLPMGPDTPALLTCLAKQYGEPSTEELLRAARPRTAAPASATSSADSTSGNKTKSGDGADVASTGVGANTGGAADPGLPPCMAGDWRRALTTPLRIVHGTPLQLPLMGSLQISAAGSPPGTGEGSRTGHYVGAQIVPSTNDDGQILTFYAPLTTSSGAVPSSPHEAPQ